MVLVSAAYVAFTVTAEEERLIAIYGDEFRRYCERVPRFIPRFRLFHSTETIEVQIRGLRRIDSHVPVGLDPNTV